MKHGYWLVCLGCGLLGCLAQTPSEEDAGILLLAGAGPSATPSDGAPNASNQQASATLDPVATGLAGTPIYRIAAKSVRFSPNGQHLLAGSGDGMIHIWDVGQKRFHSTRKAHENWTFDLAFHPDGSVLASAGGDDLIKLWNTSGGDLMTTLRGHADDVHGVAFTPDGRHLLSGGDDTNVLLWDWNADAATPTVLSGHDRQVTAVAVNPQGDLAASAGRDRTVRLWQIPRGEAAGVLKGHGEDVVAVAFSVDGQFLASAGYDGLVKIWNVKSREAVANLAGHAGRIYAVAYHPKRDMLVSGGHDATLRGWDAASHKATFVLSTDSIVSSMAFSSDGKFLSAATSDGRIILYDFRAETPKQHAQLLPPEWRAAAAPQQADTSRLDAEESLRLNTVASMPDDPNWPNAVGQLSQSGDAFTLHVLRNLDAVSLSPANRELHERTVAVLQDRLKGETAATVLPLIEPRLERAALCDLECGILEGTLIPWTFESLQPYVDDRTVRRELERIQSEYEPAGRDEFPFGSLRQRVRAYAAELLKSG